MEQIEEALANLSSDEGLDVLAVYGNDISFNSDPGFLKLKNLKKLILIGAKIIHAPSMERRLDDSLESCGEWDCNKYRDSEAARGYGDPNAATFIIQHKVSSIEEALNADARKKKVYIVQNPIQS